MLRLLHDHITEGMDGFYDFSLEPWQKAFEIIQRMNELEVKIEERQKSGKLYPLRGYIRSLDRHRQRRQSKSVVDLKQHE